MKQVFEELKTKLEDLSTEELQSIYGGAYWEVRVVNGKFVFIFHLRDD